MLPDCRALAVELATELRARVVSSGMRQKRQKRPKWGFCRFGRNLRPSCREARSNVRVRTVLATGR
jgi:hypothetical protein